MKMISGKIKTEVIPAEHVGKVVQINGCIHKIREMSEFSFILLRTGANLIQCIYNKEITQSEGSWVCVSGVVKAEVRSENGYEILINQITELSISQEQLPITINKKEHTLSLSKNLDNRIISLRHPKERAIFKVQQSILKGFREFLEMNRFTEIKSPKLVSGSAEGGANVFKLDYFGRKAMLAQSPQFYKEIMVGVFGKVFETGPVFRAEKHDTSRHVNEYTSLDIEMGFIESFYEIIEIETAILRHIFKKVSSECSKELNMYGIALPEIKEIPSIKFSRAKEILREYAPEEASGEKDLKPIEEKLLFKYIKEKYNSDFVFVTHYPTEKRPFYTMDSSVNPLETESFDLLYKGLEITTGGQRIHNYEILLSKIQSLGMNPMEFESFTALHKYGIPPHGGFGMGLERLTARILNIDNVKQACLFPRDINRITP